MSDDFVDWDDVVRRLPLSMRLRMFWTRFGIGGLHWACRDPVKMHRWLKKHRISIERIGP